MSRFIHKKLVTFRNHAVSFSHFLDSLVSHFYAGWVSLLKVCLYIFAAFGLWAAPSKASAESAPLVHIDVIDSDGQVSPTQWRSGATWVWSQNRLTLQTAVEIPSHLATTLPPSIAGLLRGTNFHGPFHLQDDHLFLILELRSPIEIFKLDEARSLRVSADFDHTNWMRNSNCRDANPSLNEVEDFDETGADAFFISLYCHPGPGGTWVEVAASSEATLSFEPRESTRLRPSAHGTEFWIPAGSAPRILTDVIVVGASGDASSRYELASAPVARYVSHQTMPVAWVAPEIASPAPVIPSSQPIIGVDAQLVEAHGAVDSSATGRAAAELAIVSRFEHPLNDGFFDADLELPIRRLGAGLNARGASSHFTWLNAGYEIKGGPVSWTFGGELSVLDVYTPDLRSEVSMAPSVQAHIGSLYSVTFAPFDFNRSLSVLRGRADLPITADQKNRLTFEAMLGRMLIQPQANSWNFNGATIGFVGEF